MSQEIELLNIILTAVFSLLVLFFIIWDHVKDGRLLTKRVQGFYEDIENLIYFYYQKEIVNEKSKKNQESLNFIYPKSLNECANQHHYAKHKIKTEISHQ